MVCGADGNDVRASDHGIVGLRRNFQFRWRDRASRV